MTRGLEDVQRADDISHGARHWGRLAVRHELSRQMHDMGDALIFDERGNASGILDIARVYDDAGDLLRRRNHLQPPRMRIEIVGDQVETTIEQRFDGPRTDAALRTGDQYSHSVS